MVSGLVKAFILGPLLHKTENVNDFNMSNALMPIPANITCLVLLIIDRL